MRFEFKPSFNCSIKSFSPSEKDEIKDVASKLIDVLSGDQQFHHGLGLKRFMWHFGETRKGIKTRILFRWEGDLIEFVLAGSHDDVKLFLRN